MLKLSECKTIVNAYLILSKEDHLVKCGYKYFWRYGVMAIHHYSLM